MSSIKPRIRIACAIAALGTVALLASCRGFFVKPTVTSLAIGPANLTLAPGTSYQMVATATYSDGSTNSVTGQSVWTSSDPSVANFTSAGMLMAASLQNLTTLPGTTSVTASDGTVSSSSQTVNVCPVVQTITLTVNKGSSASITAGQPLTFVAVATFNGVTGNNDVTANVTWNIGSTTIVSSIDSTGNGTTTPGGDGVTTVSASLCGATSKTVSVTVSG